MTRADPPIALVSGGNRGLGLEICRGLAQKGMRVILTCRDEARGRSVVQGLNSLHGSVVYHPLDVTQPDSILALHGFVTEQYGRLDVLINNAAILVDKGMRIDETGPERFLETLDTNFMGPLRLCQAFIPMMLSQGYGRVVNVSSDAGQIKGMLNDMPAYRISKIALNGLTLILADWVRGSNVLVNAAHPGWVKTDMGGPNAVRRPEDAARGILWLSTLPEGGPNGGFFVDGKPFPW